jgi:hypothetical protein
MAARDWESLERVEKPLGKVFMKADRWYIGCCCEVDVGRRSRNSVSMFDPRISRADSPLAGGVSGRETPVMLLWRWVVLRWKSVG